MSRSARAEPALLQHAGEIAQQVAHDLLDCLGRADRLEQPALDERHLGVFTRGDRLRDRSQRLVEPRDRRQAETARERPSRDRQEVRDGLEAEAPRGAERARSKPQRHDWQRRECAGGCTRFGADEVAAAVARERVRRARCVCDRYTCREACPLAEGDQTPAEALLAAMQAARAAQQQHRHVGVSRNQLQAPRCHHRDLARLRHDRSGRAVSHRILDYGQQRGIVARLRVDDVGGRQARLLERRSVEVRPAAGP